MNNLSTKFVHKTFLKSVLFIVAVQFLALFALKANAAECVEFNRVVERETGDYSIYYHTVLTSENCTYQIVMNSSEYAVLKYIEETQLDIDNQVDLLTSAYISSAFTFGFGAQILFWFIGFKIKVANTAIKRF